MLIFFLLQYTRFEPILLLCLIFFSFFCDSFLHSLLHSSLVFFYVLLVSHGLHLLRLRHLCVCGVVVPRSARLNQTHTCRIHHSGSFFFSSLFWPSFYFNLMWPSTYNRSDIKYGEFEVNTHTFLQDTLCFAFPFNLSPTIFLMLSYCTHCYRIRFTCRNSFRRNSSTEIVSFA